MPSRLGSGIYPQLIKVIRLYLSDSALPENFEFGRGFFLHPLSLCLTNGKIDERCLRHRGEFVARCYAFWHRDSGELRFRHYQLLITCEPFCAIVLWRSFGGWSDRCFCNVQADGNRNIPEALAVFGADLRAKGPPSCEPIDCFRHLEKIRRQIPVSSSP